MLVLSLTAGVSILSVVVIAFAFSGITRRSKRNRRTTGRFTHVARLEQLEPLQMLNGASISAGAYDLLNERVAENASSFFVYQDADSALNHGFPSGFFPAGGEDKIEVDVTCVNEAVSPTGCSNDVAVFDRTRGNVARVSFDPLNAGEFAGFVFEEPERFLTTEAGNGYDLTGATKVVFDIRTPTAGGIKVQFGVAGHNSDFIPIPQSANFCEMELLFSELGISANELEDVQRLFSVSTNDLNAPNGGTVLLDNIRFEPVPANPLRSPDPRHLGFPLSNETFGVIPSTSNPLPPDQVVRNLATTYESTLTLLSLIERGGSTDLQHARLIADTMLYALENDIDPPTGLPVVIDSDNVVSHGLHDGYSAGDIAIFNDQGNGGAQGGNVKLAGFSIEGDLCAPDNPGQESSFCLLQDGATGGNNAFAMLALLGAYRAFNETEYLDGAREIGRWIDGVLADNTGTGFGGYYFGFFEGGEVPRVLRKNKSIENNADIYAAFSQLSAIESDLGQHEDAEFWQQRANHAGDFVIEMFDEGDPFDLTDGHFYAGTIEVGTPPGPGVKPSSDPNHVRGGDVINTADFLDSNSFITLALANSPRYRTMLDWREPVRYMQSAFRVTEILANGQSFEGFSIAVPPEGDIFRPNPSPDGIAWEFTGQAVTAMRYVDWLYGVSEFKNDANHIMGEISHAQTLAPFSDGKGLVATTLQGENDANSPYSPVDHCLTTPFQCIPERVGLAATNWAIYAENDINIFALDMLPPEIDYGDAPDPNFLTLVANDGAGHLLTSQLFLGASVDGESDGQPTATADGDDTDGNNDDDGVAVIGAIIPGLNASLTVTVSDGLGNGAFLDAWLDLDGDGMWSHPGEQILASRPVGHGANVITFPVDPGAVPGTTFARFRLSSAGGLTPTGIADDGEVEDYEFEIAAPRIFVVDSTGSGGDLTPGDGVCQDIQGQCTLFAAIEEANASPNDPSNPDVIAFNIAGGGTQTIQSPLVFPAITDAVVIDGTTQPGYAGQPLVELDGSLTASGTSGLVIRIAGGGSVIRGLAINGFPGQGIFISRSAGNLIEQNHLGTDFTGTIDLGNGGAGLHILNGESNTVFGNLISGNEMGVVIEGPLSTGNVLQANVIGASTDGHALKNRLVNVDVAAAPNNLIGGPGGLGNVVVGSKVGIGIRGSQATGNMVLGNSIGNTPAGTAILNNRGIEIKTLATGNTIGGAGDAGNVISGNTKGVLLNSVQNNLVHGNKIGTNEAGDAALPNVRGVLISGGSNNQIGNEPNVISGNIRDGVRILGSTATGNVIRDNFIGTNADGDAAIPNRDGVLISPGADGNTVGGMTDDDRNVISGNTRSGVVLQSDNNSIVGNYIGTDASGMSAVPNETGVLILRSTGQTIGGPAWSGAGNLISGNSEEGVLIKGDGATSNTIRGNLIGTDAGGAVALGNKHGVRIESDANTIGGDTPVDGNVISGNTQNGIYLDGTAATSNLIQSNRIGIMLTGDGGLANARSGVLIEEASGNTIGGVGLGNAIGGNTQQGIRIAGLGATGNLVQGNAIGFDALTGTPVPNRDGVRIADGASSNRIGGTVAGEGNEIAHNAGRGVWVNDGTGNAVTRNSIHDNAALGISIGGQARTPNDVDDPDVGANNLQNFPEIAMAVFNSGNLDVEYLIPTIPGNAAFPILVEFFLADSGGDQGQTFLGQHSYDSPGAKSISVAAGSARTGQTIVATATDANGNTSEFSAGIVIDGPSLSLENLDDDATKWNVYTEMSPTYRQPTNITNPAMAAPALLIGLTGGAPYSNAHYYSDITGKDDDRVSTFTFSMDFLFPSTTFNNDPTPSRVQALEFSMSRWLGERRWEMAIQLAVVGCGAPNWRYWDPLPAIGDRWVDLPAGIVSPSPQLAPGWHHFELVGRMVGDNVQYSSLRIDSSPAADLSSLIVSSVATPGSPDRLSAAVQLDGNKTQTPYDVILDRVSITGT